jgi:cysteinyl-tRNA synthetase
VRIATDKYEKESVSDFALWKKAHPGDEGLGAAWDSPFGKGRPGWHIECSAMCKRYLGETLDVHAGGVDLMFPHHENEIAQSEAANGTKLSRIWLHSEHLADATGAKMSKSAGGFTTLRDLVAAGHDPITVRYFLIASAHYRQRVRLSEEALHSAAEQVRRLRELHQRLSTTTPAAVDSQDVIESATQTRALYREALDDDLNLPRGLGHVFDFVREVNSALDREALSTEGVAASRGLLRDVDAHLDLFTEESSLDAEVENLIAEREAARKAKDFARSDSIREVLRERGIALEDSKEGVRWKRIGPAGSPRREIR